MTYNVGVVGTGFMGTTLAIQINKYPELSIRALADSNENNLRECADQLSASGISLYDSWEEMLGGGLDGVIITSPPEVRLGPITESLSYNIDIYCEKPIHSTVKTAKKIARLVSEMDAKFQVGFQRRLHPAYRWLCNQWSDRKPQHVYGLISLNWLLGDYSDTWKTDSSVTGSGYVFDTGIHLIDVVLWASGIEPYEITADLSMSDSHNIDICGHTEVTGTEGEIVHLEFNGEAPRSFEYITFSDGRTVTTVDRGEWFSTEALLGVFDSEDTHTSHMGPEVDRFEPGESTAELMSKTDAIFTQIKTGDTPLATAREAVLATAICEATIESDKEGSPVRVETQFDGV